MNLCLKQWGWVGASLGVFAERGKLAFPWFQGWLLAFVLALMAGCVFIPTPEHGLLSGRGAINEEDMVLLEVGQTTREQVLLRFGEPAAILDDERTLIYYWRVLRGYIVALASVGMNVWPIGKDYLFLMEFDDKGILKRFERTSLGLMESVAERVDQWTPLGSVKLSDIERTEESAISDTRGRFVINPAPKPD